MKKTSFLMSGSREHIDEFVNEYIPTFVEKNLVDIVEENNGFTVYIKYDESDLSMKELEECFKHVFFLDDYLDAWNTIQQYSENI